ncbi:MAG: hypothetical protein WC071_04475 [Victivallaceae bacterium]
MFYHVSVSLVSMSMFFAMNVTAENQLQEIPLVAKSLSGCYVQNGTIKLYEKLPSQQSSENVVLEAEDAMAIYFQEDVFARKSGQKANELIQIKESADNYKPQAEASASGGKYIDYCRQANYQFNLNKPGEYYVWMRHKVPFKAGWSYHIQIDNRKLPVVLTDRIPGPDMWFWVKETVGNLDAGTHSLVVSDLLNGKRLDTIILTCDNSFDPNTASFKATSLQDVNDGIVYFHPLSPVGLLAWEKLTYQTAGQGMDYNFYASQDSGKTWQVITNNNLRDLNVSGVNPLEIKLELKRNKNIDPAISSLKAVYSFDSQSFAELKNQYLKLLFSRKTGALTGIVNQVTNTTIQAEGITTNMFDLLLKAPDQPQRQWLSQREATLIDSKLKLPNYAQFTWEFPAWKIIVICDITLGDNQLSKWDLKVVNNNPTYDVLEVVAPILSELKISASPEQDTLAWPFSAGEFIKFPASKGEHSIAYPDHAGLPFVDFYNEHEGLYFASHDCFLVSTHFISKASMGQDAIELSINRKHRIKAGSSRTYHYAIAVHAGDWHTGAKFYRNYFYSEYPVNTYAPWLRKCDAWLGGSATGHGGLMNKSKDYSVMLNDFKRASFMSLSYIQAWGSTFNGACPTYYLPRIDKGGENLFESMIDIWRKADGQIGYYFHGNAVTPYYLLTDKYFGVEWNKYPEKYRPPTWDWYVKNREYTSENSDVGKDKLLKITDEVNAGYETRVLKHGNYEESVSGYIPMTWRSKAFPDYLEKWISIYVKDYHCNTAYLDTFAFRNDLADFNPYLKLHGEGDKPMYKMEFINKLMHDMRKLEPGFCALTEGVADVFGTQLYFLLSGFARNPNIFRYTLPDQIFFQGSQNGLWAPPLTRKSLLQSYLMGNRFDLVGFYPANTYYMLKLRQRISPFLNYAIFNDTEGIKVSDPAIEVYNHLTLPETNKYIANAGTRCVTFTIANREGKNGSLVYTLPAGFTPQYGYRCELNGEPQKMNFKTSGNQVTFELPKAEASAVILIDKLESAHQWTATVEQSDIATVEAKIFNYTNEQVTFKVEAICPEANFEQKIQNVTIPGGSLTIVKFIDKSGLNNFKLAHIKISSPAYNDKFIISLGNAGYKIPAAEKLTPKAEKTVKVIPPAASATKGIKVLLLDFEAPEFADNEAFKGKGCFKLKGDGAFKMHKIPLTLENNTPYRVSLALRKGFNVSKVGHDNNVMVVNYDKNKKIKHYLSLGSSIPIDDKWHFVAGNFVTDNDLDNCGLYIYNKKSRDLIWIDEIKIEKIK